MKLANLPDEELWKVSMQKTRKGTATAEAKRAAQMLYTRNITHGGFGGGISYAYPSHLDHNPERKWKGVIEP